MVGLPVRSVLTMGSPHTKPPPYDFLNLYGACLHPAGTEDPQIQVLDDLPRYMAFRHGNRLQDRHVVDSRV